MDEDSGTATGNSHPVDADLFLALNQSLRAAFQQLAGAPLSAERRGRWQRRLIAITNTAKRDMRRAQAQLDRYLQDWRRERDG